MKTQPMFKFIVFGMIGALTIASCRKEAGIPAIQESTTEKTAAATPQSLSNAYAPYQVLGKYSVRGSRTKYRGQANEAGDNISVIFDYFGERTFADSRADRAVTCGYCSDGYVSQGWKYIIRYNAATKQILLSPNDTMAAAIKPGSFKQLAAVASPNYKSFTFQTRYTDTDGNENEVIDILGKE